MAAKPASLIQNGNCQAKGESPASQNWNTSLRYGNPYRRVPGRSIWGLVFGLTTQYQKTLNVTKPYRSRNHGQQNMETVIGTWNVRTLDRPEAQANFLKHLTRYRVNIAAI